MRAQIILALGLLAAALLPTAPVRADSPSPLQHGNAHIAPTLELAAQMGIGQTGLGLAPPAALNVSNRGNGPVMHTPTAFAIFWLPPGRHFQPDASAAGDAQFESLVTSFLQNLGGLHSASLWRVITQYGDANGPINTDGLRFGGSFTDPTAYPNGNTLQEGDIQQAVRRAMASQGWSAGLDSAFLVYTAYGVQSCDSNGACSLSTWCAYHSQFDVAGTHAVFANIPALPTSPKSGCTFFTSSPNSDLVGDLAVNSTSHELLEMATDPLPGSNPAWVDSKGQEIGDKCNGAFGPTDQDGADVLLGPGPVHPFMVQAEWSNSSLGCQLQLPNVTSITPDLGPDYGGYQVTLVGTGLRSVPDGTTIAFGSRNATNISCTSQQSDQDVCTATVPSGDYNVNVVVTAGGAQSPIGGIQFTYQRACARVSIGSQLSSPQPSGTSIRLLESGASPDLCYLQWYRFLVTDPSGHTATIKEGPANIADWNTQGLAAGVYTLTLQGFANAQDLSHLMAQSGTMQFTLTDPPPGGPGYGGGASGGGGLPGGPRCNPCRQM